MSKSYWHPKAQFLFPSGFILQLFQTHWRILIMKTEHRTHKYLLARFTCCGHFAPFPLSNESAHSLSLPLPLHMCMCVYIWNMYILCVFYVCVYTCAHALFLNFLKVSSIAFYSYTSVCTFSKNRNIASQVNSKMICLSNLPSIFQIVSWPKDVHHQISTSYFWSQMLVLFPVGCCAQGVTGFWEP